jgi:hypothetical protein
VIRNVPAGLGEPVFDKFEAKLGHAMLSIPATKGFEIGSGFRGTEVPGSQHNDPFICREGGKLGTETNWSGGVQGGITNSEDIYFRYAVCSFPKGFPANHNASSALPSSPLPRSRRHKKLLNMMEQKEYLLLVVATTPVSFLVLFQSSSPWPPSLSWTNFSSKTLARLLQTSCLPSPPCHPPWSCPPLLNKFRIQSPSSIPLYPS